MHFIDTHTHIDGEEFAQDLPQVIQRARDAGAKALFVPGINEASVNSIRSICQQYPDYCYGMIGLHPEDVRNDYRDVINRMKQADGEWIAIGEVGLDFYWSREYEQQQLEAFELQVQWSIQRQLPLMIHCRKAQNEMVRILRRYEKDLVGGVFHCFTGNEQEATELLSFPRFALGIGGVLTFKKSNLPTTLPAVVPLQRIVLETDAPYMAPTPHRGTRNESAYVTLIIQKLAEAYATTPEEVATITTHTAENLFLHRA